MFKFYKFAKSLQICQKPVFEDTLKINVPVEKSKFIHTSQQFMRS